MPMCALLRDLEKTRDIRQIRLKAKEWPGAKRGAPPGLGRGGTRFPCNRIRRKGGERRIPIKLRRGFLSFDEYILPAVLAELLTGECVFYVSGFRMVT